MRQTTTLFVNRMTTWLFFQLFFLFLQPFFATRDVGVKKSRLKKPSLWHRHFAQAPLRVIVGIFRSHFVIWLDDSIRVLQLWTIRNLCNPIHCFKWVWDQRVSGIIINLSFLHDSQVLCPPTSVTITPVASFPAVSYSWTNSWPQSPETVQNQGEPMKSS